VPRGDAQHLRGVQRLYSKEVHKHIVDAIKKGSSRTAAFASTGLNADTIFGWLRSAKINPEMYPEYVKLLTDIEREEADVQIQMSEVVVNAALSGNPNMWPAAMTYLERRDPENWGKRDKTTIESDKPLVQVNQLIVKDPDALEQSRDLLSHLAAGGTALSLGTGAGDEPAEVID